MTDGADDSAALARDAQERGQQALVVGDGVRAMRWLDRAHRLAPHDGTITLALATACLRRDDGRAEALFRAVAKAEDVRAAWLGLAAARFRLGDGAGAAAALADALARHVPEAALVTARDSLADAVVRGADAAGWCGITGDGQLVLRPAASGETEIRLDGRRCAEAAVPRAWMRAREATIRIAGRHLLGSPIQLAAIRRVAGFVEAHEGGLRGWAWYPGDPDTDPVLLIRGAGGRGRLRIAATDIAASVQHAAPLARPRGFAVPARALAAIARPLHALGRDGAELLGSPLDPDAEQSAAAAAASALAGYLSPQHARAASFAPPAMPADIAVPRLATGASRRRRQAAVIIPVYGKTATVLSCLDSVLATVGAPHGIIVIDDASPEPALRRALDALAAEGRVRLVRHARNRGFPASVNDGIAAAAGRDAVLLNSDTLVPPGWLERLRDAAYATRETGTATPLSNHASILSYPGPQGSNPVPDRDATLRLDAIARRANKGTVVEIPVGVGFCLYMRRDCIDAAGPFRADMFAQGYGEENDFCLRARRLGWRHVAVAGLFVAHLGGASFGQGGGGQAARYLQVRNETLLNRLHPGYDRLIAAFSRADPLAEARRRFDLARWRPGGQAEAPAGERAARKAARGRAQSVILVTHDDGGGVERQVGVAAAAHRAAGLRPIVLRPAREPDGPAMLAVDGASAGFPNLRYALPRELPALLRLLRASDPRLVEVHHTLHHAPAIYELIARLGVPYDVQVHDYPWFCPQVSLVGADRRYCGEPAVVRCEACVADAGRVTDEAIGVQALRDRSAGFLGAARRVVAPSADVAARMRRHFPSLRPEIVPLEDDDAVADPPRPQARSGLCRVCTLGAIGVHKGYDVLLACARDAAERSLPLEFVVVGHTIDDARLLATGRVFVTGRFAPEEAVSLIRAQDASVALLPSVWPETWSFGLTELWRAGLSVAAFDFGAPAERIRRTGRGFLLPLGLPPRGINQALVAAIGLTGHEGA
ncbi:MAG TPA: glycosyltransferase [Acetobacteraceae bacterium]|nr:glycosyltransferase [Acetobacteraceae bacterium]